MAQKGGEPMQDRPANVAPDTACAKQQNGRPNIARDGPGNGAERPSRPLRVLLVEDSATNQMLAASLLKKAGHTVETAMNGNEALAVLASRAFDFVLMDVEMPGMDGFEATARIRAQELPGGEHLPIVAMTAHATNEDRQRCLQAGMDGYISKPLHAGALYQALASFKSSPAIAEPMTGDPQPPTGACGTLASGAGPETTLAVAQLEVFDRAILLGRLGGREDRLQTIVQTFLHESTILMAELLDAITSGDFPSMQRPAHSLQGAVAIFGASSVVEAASRLEAVARVGQLAAAKEAYAHLEQEFRRLILALAAVAAQRSSGPA
jgi:CheY-like chemotaxis protein/HPt (histidine-containing phosphotransfer) domain-containing protein